MTPLALFAVDPVGLGGVLLRGAPGPTRDLWMAGLRAALPEGTPMRRVPLGISAGRLLGGIDLARTLQAGRALAERGVLAEADGGIVVLALAERLPAERMAQIAAVLDAGEVVVERDGLARRHPARLGVVALDEGVEKEGVAPGLLDRLAFHLAVDALEEQDVGDDGIAAARGRLSGVSVGDEVVETLCATAMALGVGSLRAPVLALRAARAAAALAGRDCVLTEDVALAARLVLAPRATRVPAAPEEAAAAEPESRPEEGGESPDDREAEAGEMGEVVLAAAAAAVPAGLLEQLGSDRPRSGAAGRRGAATVKGRRGRPLGIRAGDPRQGDRLNLIETLRAAAPWQRLRTRRGACISVRREDFRVTRLAQRAETTTIFMVDASGSQAAGRLAEAKGAVELLLAECYIRRDQVAVVAFRGRRAEVLLPPTRSLVRAKRSLGGLPGGGGTPLALGIEVGATMADAVRRRGGQASLVLLTDGRPNVGRDGKGGARRGGAGCGGCSAPGSSGGSCGGVGGYIATSTSGGGTARAGDGGAVCGAALCNGAGDNGSGSGVSDRRLHGWPNRQFSRFVRAGGLSWHVQVMGEGPPLLFVHGTGGATHSWRDLAPMLAEHFTVVAPDLPGHGFTDAPAAARQSIPGMARALQVLLWTLNVRPVLAAGHSAGAAVLIRMCLDGQIEPGGLVALNGALQPMEGMAGQLFSPLAKVMAGLPILPNLFAWRARDRMVVERLLENTGSRIGADGVALYARLVREPGHAAAALQMMAYWDLRPLVADLGKLAVPLLLIVGGNDRTVPPAGAETVRGLVPGAEVVTMPGLGHLAHEEDPAGTAALMMGFARKHGLLGPA